MPTTSWTILRFCTDRKQFLFPSHRATPMFFWNRSMSKIFSLSSSDQEKQDGFACGHSVLQEWWATQSFLFVAICLMEKWVNHADELWQPEPAAREPAESAAGSSRASAKKAAQADMNKLRRKTVNSLHLMAKVMTDPEVKSNARIIAYVLSPEAKASGQMFHDLRSEEATRRYYASWSHWGWLAVAVETLQVLENLDRLSRIGFVTSFVSDRSPSQISADDVLADRLFNVIKGILKHRAGSALWYTTGAGSAAGLVSESPTLVASSLNFFRQVAATIATRWPIQLLLRNCLT